MSSRSHIDLAVIGSGGAAMAAGIAAREAGATVVLVERGPLGGTCLNNGCVPSKTLLTAAGTRQNALTNPFAGVTTSANDVDLGALVRQKAELVQRLQQAKYADVADAWGFEVLPGEARFHDGATLTVDGQTLRAGAYVVATGAQPHTAGIAGVERVGYLTSTSAMELTELPESLLVLGGGPVGLEQAQLFAHLGVEVTVIGTLAPNAEPELQEVMTSVFVNDGITVVADRVIHVERSSNGMVVATLGSGRRSTSHQLLIATGRRPDTTALNLAAAGVATDGRGFIVTDDHQRTSSPRVYAAGDVTGAPQYVYVAAASGRVAAINALAGDDAPRTSVDYAGMPSVVFTRPQLASVGLTEAQAGAQGYTCAARILRLDDVPRALANRDTRGAVKLTSDAATGRLLGVHAVADAAGELMLPATYALKAGMTVDDLARTWAPYLTMSESLRIAAGLFRDHRPTSCCA